MVRIRHVAYATLALFEFHFGHCIGDWVARQLNERYQPQEMYGIECIVDNRTNEQYIPANITNVVEYVASQNPRDLAQELQK